MMSVLKHWTTPWVSVTSSFLAWHRLRVLNCQLRSIRCDHVLSPAVDELSASWEPAYAHSGDTQGGSSGFHFEHSSALYCFKDVETYEVGWFILVLQICLSGSHSEFAKIPDSGFENGQFMEMFQFYRRMLFLSRIMKMLWNCLFMKSLFWVSFTSVLDL